MTAFLVANVYSRVRVSHKKQRIHGDLWWV